MIMMSMYFTGVVPFKTVLITPLVRDERGQKMSKSKGNVIDPLILMDKYGTDAMRFTLMTLATPGRDIHIGESLVETGRNFVTKIWNAAKFLELNGCVHKGGIEALINGTFPKHSNAVGSAKGSWCNETYTCARKHLTQEAAHPNSVSEELHAGANSAATSNFGANSAATSNWESSGQITHPLNLWILQKLHEFKKSAFCSVETYRFDFFAQSIQKFLKDVFCDVYIEGVKACLASDLNDNAKLELRHVSGTVFCEFLAVANPIMPFITEYLWGVFAGSGSLVVKPWNFCSMASSEIHELTDFYISLAEEVRSVRGLLGIRPSEKIGLSISDDANAEFAIANQYWINSLCRLDKIAISPPTMEPASNFHNRPPPVDSVEPQEPASNFHNGHIKFVFRGKEFFLHYPSGLDVIKARQLLENKRRVLCSDIQKLTAKVSNKAYEAANPEKWSADNILLRIKSEELRKLSTVEL
jgi:valyl-tRNA synthetase